MLKTSELRTMVSHRVTFDYQSGTRIVGYLSACVPGQGPVHVALLSRAQIFDPQGQILGEHKELAMVPDLLEGFRITEGPGGF